MQTNPPVVLKSLYPTSLISRPSFFLFLSEKGNTMTRKGPTLDLGRQCSFHHWTQWDCSLSPTSYTSRVPCPSLAATCPCCHTWTRLFFPNGCPLPRKPRVLTTPLNHNFMGSKLLCPVTFHCNCTKWWPWLKKSHQVSVQGLYPLGWDWFGAPKGIWLCSKQLTFRNSIW